MRAIILLTFGVQVGFRVDKVFGLSVVLIGSTVSGEVYDSLLGTWTAKRILLGGHAPQRVEYIGFWAAEKTFRGVAGIANWGLEVRSRELNSPKGTHRS